MADRRSGRLSSQARPRCDGAGYDEEQVAGIRRWPIDAMEKGFGGPAHVSPLTAGQLARDRPPAGAGLLSTPRVLLRERALRHNISAMAAYCAAHAVSLFPHGKTTMAPQILAAQLDGGAAGVTVASISQARMFRRFGVRNVLLANELVDDASISWVARELTSDRQFSFLCYVDSVAGAGRLDGLLAARGFPSRLRVLVELGHDDGRTGCRSRAEALAVAAAVGRAPRLQLAGVAGYEGSLLAATPAETAQKARAYCAELGQLTLSLTASGQFPEPPLLTAGGSAYFDEVVDVLGRPGDWSLVLRSGCYVTHDHGLYSRIAPSGRDRPAVPVLEPALEAWAPVLSRPERETAVLGIGRRDVSFDAGNPVVLHGRAAGGTALDTGGAVVRRLFDQHAVLSVPAGAGLAPGDEVCLGISHPCTTFDKWRWIPVLDAEDRITDVIRTFF
jgi:D-serine deaminase-like pyridoxal phosphate-dependent protein